jgi:outer membrane protein assembly factor BamA
VIKNIGATRMSVIRRERQQQLQDYQLQETADQALLAFRRLKT